LLVLERALVPERVQGWREVEAVAAAEGVEGDARVQARARARALVWEAEGAEVVLA